MKYLIHSNCRKNIIEFYTHVSMKYRNTYSESQMLKNMDEAINAMYLVEKSLVSRRPTLDR